LILSKKQISIKNIKINPILTKVFTALLLIFLNFSFIGNGVAIASGSQNSRVLEEFRNKLLNEEEIKKELEKQRILTEEDFDVLREEKSESDIEREKNELINTINE
jgi:hypothetical protein